ncbi:MAG: hypothetical protein A2Y45_00125 [Tenericutes bacterium GWC2_34_14]|nr:MAG: hypothetical protein A2Y45_00125 [Tenericutes bacterium GWC2_34_14]OHE34408.1 MAG: hypothetical protein A2012_07745 [Tenericutes bacterium GWE2_34_108]OHE35764.1 MAG: hypothetical protein A2Y46_02450 [Tenericutes bacterium GWF1_35_14]OHE39149.1 MAG: hypothetical protein A2Y44_07480 [Tenericutes bacterium GWF2_35_184]OHE42366.1 MAG: hypothetical protein A3K26_04860 [Tenericutes bacterium RIFOXYA12_FULL_35_10]OHE42784.1 MAG: hypothetical protein A2221_08755 [Tenericutes bacterium RIFOXYA
MLYLSIFMMVYGAFILVGMLLQFPFLYNNMKSKAMIKMMGKKGFNILLLVMAVAFIVIGYLIMP